MDILMIPYVNLIIKYSSSFQLPSPIVAGIIEVESSWNPIAISSAGAVGLMQVIPDLDDRPSAEELKDPETNIFWGCKILSTLYERYDSLDMALAAYNGAYQGGRIIPAGWEYIRKVHLASKKYYYLSPCQEDFLEYAPHSGTWREAAIVLKGISSTALERGREVVRLANNAKKELEKAEETWQYM